MKNLINFVLLALVLTFFSCSKEVLDPNNQVLAGRWRLAETLVDPGDGSGKWTKVPKGTNEYIDFSQDGKLSGCSARDFVSFVVADSAKLTFKKSDGVTIQNYFYKLKSGFLEMSPAGPIYCIEGCGSRYIKIQASK